MVALLPLVLTLLAAPAAAAVCPTNCGLTDFSYPFGIGTGCSMPGFNLTCDAKKRLLGSPNVTVDYMISAGDSVSALAVYVVRSVHMGSGAGTFSTSWEGPGAPFAISGRANMSLFVLGCGVTATLLDGGGTGAIVGNCSVVCAGEEVMGRLPDGLCVGLGCCRIDLRIHLRAFTLNVSRAGDGVRRDKLSFLVAGRDRYTFRPSDLEHEIDVNKVPPALLDWAIPDKPDCRRAMDDRLTYACVSNRSECHDSPIGGYVCRCSMGFSGNPYVVDGCTRDQVYGSAHPKANCPTMCGNVSVPFPFGTELGCFARINLYLACNPGPSPAILQMTERLLVTEISIDEGFLRIQKLSDPGDFLDDRSTKLYSFSEESGTVKWAVDNHTCRDAMLNKNEHRCTSARSHCVDVTDDRTSKHVGYMCKCSSGFQGNPYLQDGCTAINEFLQPDKHTCNGICHNSLGGFTCSSCPHGTRFDGIARKCKASDVVLGVTIGLSSDGGILFLAAIAVIIIRRWKKDVQKQLRKRYFRKNKGILLEQLVSSDSSASGSTKIFSLEELEKATNNFGHSRVVGHGGHGTVYKGILTDQRVVAIKRANLAESSEIDQFINEVAILSQINHRNVVKLHGCCLEAEVPLLVYEFISNGTLYDLLHCEKDGQLLPLPWEERLRIATEIAGALTYLHSAASLSILHRDIKSMNVLLNDSHMAKVSDFGASRSIPIDQTHVVTAVQGTFGYLDPEYYDTGRLTEKSDVVYSFGVILVELLMRKKPLIENENGEKQNLSNYFLWAMGESWPLKETVDAYVPEEGNKEVIEHMAGLAQECLNMRRHQRPNMKDVEIGLQSLRARNVAPGKDEVARHPYRGAGRHDGRRGGAPVAGHDGTRQYSLEQEFLLSLRVPR